MILVKEIFDGNIARQNDLGFRPQNQAIDGTVLLRPFLELLVGIFRWHLHVS